MDGRRFAFEVSSHVGWKVNPAEYKDLGEALLRGMSINVNLISWQFGEVNTSAERRVFFEIEGITHNEALKCQNCLVARFSRDNVNYSRPVVREDKIRIHPAIHRYEITDKNVYSILLKIFKASFDPLENIRNDRRDIRFIDQQNRKKLTRSRSIKNIMSLFARKPKEELKDPKPTLKAKKERSLARKSY